jgi:hypothetical protein
MLLIFIIRHKYHRYYTHRNIFSFCNLFKFIDSKLIIPSHITIGAIHRSTLVSQNIVDVIVICCDRIMSDCS